MTVNKIDSFNEKAEALFRARLEKLGYNFDQVIINYYCGQKWSVHHIYKNSKAQLKIIIKQEPYYTDYGFSFFIYKEGMDEYNILYNLPHEEQDKEDKFLSIAFDELFSSQDMVEMISGKSWRRLGAIPFPRPSPGK